MTGKTLVTDAHDLIREHGLPILTMTLWGVSIIVRSVDLAIIGWLAGALWLADSRGWFE